MSIPIPSHDKFSVSLNRALDGDFPLIANAKCKFSYIWDFKTNTGLAHLISINGSTVNITLHPLDITGILAFMSDMPPTRVVVNGQEVTLHRVILDIYLRDGERAAAIMFNEEGSLIERIGEPKIPPAWQGKSCHRRHGLSGG